MDDLIASEEDLQAFCSAPAGQRKLTPALRGIVVESATRGVLRYPWPLVRVLMAEMLDQVLLEYEAEAHVEVGPVPEGMSPEAAKAVRADLAALLNGWTRGPPFTLQRLAELVAAPGRQYSRFSKLSLALEKLLLVVSVLRPPPAPAARPRLSELPPVNENPLPQDATGGDVSGPAGTAHRPLVNGGDDAARGVAAGAGGGFASTMPGAAENAFLSSVFSSAPAPHDVGPAAVSAAAPAAAAVRPGSPPILSDAQPVAAAVAAASAAAANGEPMELDGSRAAVDSESDAEALGHAGADAAAGISLPETAMAVRP